MGGDETRFLVVTVSIVRYRCHRSIVLSFYRSSVFSLSGRVPPYGSALFFTSQITPIPVTSLRLIPLTKKHANGAGSARKKSAFWTDSWRRLEPGGILPAIIQSLLQVARTKELREAHF